MLLLGILSALEQLQKSITCTNITLDKIAKQMGVPNTVTENIDSELKSLIAEGKKIKAIKRYRMVTGLGIKEAKEYVDILAKQEQ